MQRLAAYKSVHAHRKHESVIHEFGPHTYCILNDMCGDEISCDGT